MLGRAEQTDLRRSHVFLTTFEPIQCLRIGGFPGKQSCLDHAITRVNSSFPNGQQRGPYWSLGTRGSVRISDLHFDHLEAFHAACGIPYEPLFSDITASITPGDQLGSRNSWNPHSSKLKEESMTLYQTPTLQGPLFKQWLCLIDRSTGTAPSSGPLAH